MNTEWEQDYWTGVNPAGYSHPPERVFVLDTDVPGHQGEVLKTRAYQLLNSQPFLNSTVLEIGCGFGHMVEDLVDFGVDCYGIDISSYAIGEAQTRRPDLASRFSVQDCRDLSGYGRNDFDYVFTRDFLCVLTDVELEAFFDEVNRISRNSVHITKDGADNAEFYNPKTIAEYVSLRPNPNMRFVNIETGAIS